MNKQIKNILEEAESKWEAWNDLGGQVRADKLLHWADIMSSEISLGLNAAKIAKYQINQGLPLISEEKLMPGPTGESNHLYTSGRGVFIVSCNDVASSVALVGMITSALVAGNCVVISVSAQNIEVANKLLSTLLLACIPTSVVQVAPIDSMALLINEFATAGVVYAGDSAESAKINQQLASREGGLAQLISEVDLSLFSYITDRYYILRFITEKTRTINITAIGGNAALLALGEGDY